MNKKFVSVVGFTDLEQVKNVDLLSRDDRDIYLGLLMDANSFSDKSEKKRYINVSKALDIIRYFQYNPHSKTKLIFHYCPKNDWKKEHFSRIRGVDAGFQLNIGDGEQLKSAHQFIKQYMTMSDVKPFFIFQLNNSLIRQYTLQGAISFFYALSDLKRDYIVYDQSGGKGKEIDIDEAKKFCKKCKSFQLSPVLAGGLNPENIQSISKQIGSEYSYDAESGLRNEEDEIDIDKVNKFIKDVI